MAELGNFLVGEVLDDAESDWLDYTFIRECKDVKKLRTILRTLQSGKEGKYPELEQYAEERLLSLIPPTERRKVVAMKQQPSDLEKACAASDIDNFLSSIRETDDALRKVAMSTRYNKEALNCNIMTGTGSTRTVSIDHSTLNSNTEKKLTDEEGQTPSQRLSGYDFRAWEKFDADAAAAAIDDDSLLERENLKAKTENRRKEEYAAADNIRRKKELYLRDLDRIRDALNTNDLSDLQIKLRAGREKQKGNEYFKAGELEPAFECYSRSLALDPSNSIVYANRAIVAIRLDRLDTAEEDCNHSLNINRNYVKAWSRRGMVRFKKGRYAEAVLDFLEALKLEPGSAEYQKLLDNAKSKYAEVEGREFAATIDLSAICASKTLPSDMDPVSRCCFRGVPEKVETLRAFSGFVFQGPDTRVKCNQLSDLQLLEKGTMSLKLSPPEPHEIAKRQLDDDYVMVEVTDGETEDLVVDASDNQDEHVYRVPITFEVEEDDEDEEQTAVLGVEGNEAEEVAGYMAGYTRVPITFEDEDDDEEVEEDDEVGPHTTAGVVLPVDTGPSVVKERMVCNVSTSAVEWKERGNDLMRASPADVHGAITAYTESIRIDSRNPAAFNNRAMAYISVQKYTEADRDCSAVLTLEPSNTKALYRRAVCRHALGDLAAALDDLAELLKHDAGNGQALKLQEEVILASTEAQAVRSLTNRIDSVSSATVEDPLVMAVQQAKDKAIVALESGDLVSAIDQCIGGLRRIRSADISTTTGNKGREDERVALEVSLLTLLASAHAAQGAHAEVVRVCTEIIIVDGRNHRALVRRAEAHKRLGDVKSAKDDALRVLRIDGSSSEAMVILHEIEEETTQKSTTGADEGNPQRLETTEATAAAAPCAAQIATAPATSGSVDLASENVKQSDSLKERGNQAVKNSRLAEAVALYTQALDLHPANFAARGNRAQAYLKLKNFTSAEVDCTAIIDSKDAKAESLKQKAFYRRGLARRSLGGHASMKGSVADFEELLRVEPDNASFKAEKEKSLQLLERLPQQQSSSRKPVTPTITSPLSNISANSKSADVGVISSALEMKAVSTTKYSDPKTLLVDSKAKLSTCEGRSAVAATSAAALPKSLVSSKPEKKTAPTPCVPVGVPKTLYELERVWRGLKEHPSVFAQYLSQFKTSTCSRVFKESISLDLVSSVLSALKMYCTPEVSLTILSGLKNSSGFAMTLQLLSEDDVTCLREIVSGLELYEGTNAAVVADLKAAFALVI